MEKLDDGFGKKWREYLGLAVMAYQLMPHSSTGLYPFKILYGREDPLSKEVRRRIYVPNPSYWQL